MAPRALLDVVGKPDPHARLVALLRGLLATGEHSQTSIADETHGEVSQSAISTYLAGTRRAKLDAALAVGRAFRVRPEYFTDPGEGLDFRAYLRGASIPDWPALVDYLAAHPELEERDPAIVDEVRDQARTHGSLSYRAIDLFVAYRRAIRAEFGPPEAAPAPVPNQARPIAERRTTRPR